MSKYVEEVSAIGASGSPDQEVRKTRGEALWDRDGWTTPGRKSDWPIDVI